MLLKVSGGDHVERETGRVRGGTRDKVSQAAWAADEDLRTAGRTSEGNYVSSN